MAWQAIAKAIAKEIAKSQLTKNAKKNANGEEITAESQELTLGQIASAAGAGASEGGGSDIDAGTGVASSPADGTMAGASEAMEDVDFSSVVQKGEATDGVWESGVGDGNSQNLATGVGNLQNNRMATHSMEDGTPENLNTDTPVSPYVSQNFLQEFGHSLIGKDTDVKKGVFAYAGESLGDLIRGKVGLDTTNSRGGISKTDALMSLLVKNSGSEGDFEQLTNPKRPSPLQFNSAISPELQSGNRAMAQYMQKQNPMFRNSPMSVRKDVYNTNPTLGMKQTRQSELNQDLDKRGVEKSQDLAHEKNKIQLAWNKEDVDRQIKYDILEPKTQGYMEDGGRAVKELKENWKKYEGITGELKFDKGGWQSIKAGMVKNVAMKAHIAPLMVALERLRPELGVEAMRQLGAFRSGAMAKRFEDTFAQFSGDIKEDIANTSTSMAKNAANMTLLDEAGNPLPYEQKMQKVNAAKSQYIRRYNMMYRDMEIMEEPYFAGFSPEELAEMSNWTEKEQTLIDNAMEYYPDEDPIKVQGMLIKKGLL